MNEERNTLALAHELQAIADAGLHYSKNPFDLEHFTRVREIAAELVSACTGQPLAEIQSLFEQNAGYQTPKAVTRAAIFNDQDEVLLIHDYDGKWALPGGWCDYNQTVASNTVKEVLEEAGLNVAPGRLVCVHDNHRRNNPGSYYHSFHFFVLCEVKGGCFIPNDETTESGYFPLDALPELNLHKTTPDQLELCLRAKKVETWETQYD